jgi:hypothetical protein
MYHDIGNGMMISLMFLLRESILGLGGYESSRQCFFFFIFCEVCWLATNIVSACMGASYNITRFSYSILVDIGLLTTYDHIIILNLFIWFYIDIIVICTIDNLLNAFTNTLFLYIYLPNIGLYWCYIHIDLAFCNPLGSNIKPSWKYLHVMSRYINILQNAI